jgi:dolichyl-phosphate beta-glucosyltransferase
MELSGISIIIPIYNEGVILEKNLKLYHDYLSNLTGLDSFEIVVIDNASTDTTPQILKRFKRSYKNIKMYRTAGKGLGIALKEGLNRAKHDVVMFTAIDICFGLDIIKLSIEKYSGGYSLVLGSKGHKKSIYKAPVQRLIFSRVYNFLLRVLFNTNIRDTQGTFLINKKLSRKPLAFANSENAWFQTQLALYIDKTDKNTVEIPVKYIEQERKSKMKYTDALKILREMFEGYFKYRQYKKTTDE